MRHLTEEEMILTHYGELDAKSHLAECPECASAARALADSLAAVDEEVIPEPDSDYEARMWDRLRWRMRGHDVALASRSRRRSWIAAAAAVVLLLLGYGAGRFGRDDASVPVTSTTAGPVAAAVPPGSVAPAPEVFDLAAQQQIDRSSRLLVEVANQSAPADVDALAQREKAEALLASNRLYRTVAARSGRQAVAELLDDLEPILLELAHADSQLSPEELQAIQRRIESRELLFKLRVLSSLLNEQPATPQQAAPQGDKS